MVLEVLLHLDHVHVAFIGEDGIHFTVQLLEGTFNGVRMHFVTSHTQEVVG